MHLLLDNFVTCTGDGSLTGRKATDDGKVEPGFLCSSGTILNLVQLCDGKADRGDDETHPLCASNYLHHDIIIVKMILRCGFSGYQVNLSESLIIIYKLIITIVYCSIRVL